MRPSAVPYPCQLLQSLYEASSVSTHGSSQRPCIADGHDIQACCHFCVLLHQPLRAQARHLPIAADVLLRNHPSLINELLRESVRIRACQHAIIQDARQPARRRSEIHGGGARGVEVVEHRLDMRL